MYSFVIFIHNDIVQILCEYGNLRGIHFSSLLMYSFVYGVGTKLVSIVLVISPVNVLF